jgi:hypothetical protein
MSLEFITSATYSASSLVIVDGCFSATYDNYLVLTDGRHASNDIVSDIRFRAAGSANNAANSYALQYMFSAGSVTLTAARETGAQALFTPTASDDTNAFVAHIFSPFLAAVTTWSSKQCYGVDGSRNLEMYGTHNVASSFDGFQLVPRSSTLTGTLYVYGYVKS